MVELTWYYGWSKWKAKDDTYTVYFLWDVTGKLPFAMVASKHSDSPALYIDIYLPTQIREILVLSRPGLLKRHSKHYWKYLKIHIYTSSAVGRSHEWRSREKNLWHRAELFTVPVDLWAFLSKYIYAKQIESLQLWSCGLAHEEMSKDPHYA